MYCVSYAFAPVRCCLVVACWERADLLATVGDVYCILVSFPCGILGPRGVALIFSAYVGSDPTSTIHPPKNIRNFKHPKKIFEILATSKNIRILCLDLKKDPKLLRNDPQTSPIL